MKSAPASHRHLTIEQQVALDAPLPDFPEVAWRGVFDTYRALLAEDPREPGTPISECPETFHFANLLALLAAEMGDHVRLDEGVLTLPNFYIFCCGATGSKKSTATNLVEECISRRFTEATEHTTFTSVSSGEGLIRILCQHPNLLLRYDEVKDLFSTAARSGQRLEPILNMAYNCTTRLANNVKSVRDSHATTEYYLNLIVNGTPAHVLLDLSQQLFQGGLLNRFLVFAARPTEVSKAVMGSPPPTPCDALAKRILEQCVAWRAVAPLRGSVRIALHPEAMAIHKTWYDRYNSEQKHLSDLESSPHTRLDVFAKKLGMVYALYEAPPNAEPLISPAQIEAAHAVVDFCKGCMDWMVEAWAGQQSAFQRSEALLEQRVRSFMKKRGCCEEPELATRLKVSFTQVAKITNALVAEGTVNVTGERPRTIHNRLTCTCDT